MTNYTITLSEETYHQLLNAAQTQGVTPEHWISSQLASQTAELPPLSQLLTGLIGAIDSRVTPPTLPSKSKFGEAIAQKLAKQGIQKP
jgi:hypothetical protein